MKILALIPARMGSSRYPGKPMEPIAGKPMIGHVYEQVIKCNLVTDTVVATCDDEIFDYVHSIGGQSVMTSINHERASDRCAEALLFLEEKAGFKYDIIVMIQGDEPMTHPDMIEEALSALLEDDNVKVSNLIAEITSEEEFQDENCIKVVCDLSSNALYFSRQPIPTLKHEPSTTIGKQVCVIPFRRDFLLDYTKLQPTPLEVAESVDMMRVLEHGYKVKMVPTNHVSYAVDVPSDLKKVEEAIMRDDL